MSFAKGLNGRERWEHGQGTYVRNCEGLIKKMKTILKQDPG